MTNYQIFEIVYWIISSGILIATIYYIATAPIRAVRIGRELNDEQNKSEEKLDLFLTLFALRGSPIHFDFVNALNQIDVVFQDTPSVLVAWHNYYDALHQKNVVNQEEGWTLLRVELLSQMAISLGYGELKQVDIQKYYIPEGHQNQFLYDLDFKDAALKYFQRGSEAYDMMIANAKNYNSSQSDEQKKDS
ncbi:MAG TPA: DUF6680 family protein [Chitinophagaceae bacterium]|nr:DUF6680 family protein [Chitinophagaceae bacterium]